MHLRCVACRKRSNGCSDSRLRGCARWWRICRSSPTAGTRTSSGSRRKSASFSVRTFSPLNARVHCSVTAPAHSPAHNYMRVTYECEPNTNTSGVLYVCVCCAEQRSSSSCASSTTPGSRRGRMSSTRCATACGRRAKSFRSTTTCALCARCSRRSTRGALRPFTLLLYCTVLYQCTA